MKLICVTISVYAIHIFFSYLLRLNHYLENVHIIMLVRFKLTEEWEKRCIVKKCVASNKSPFSLTNKNIPVKMTCFLCFA